jgi:hypothetical protein
MNYITDGTFWFIIVAIAVAIGAVWYNLNKKVEATVQELERFKQVLADGARELAEFSDRQDAERDQRIEQLSMEIAELSKDTKKHANRQGKRA